MSQTQTDPAACAAPGRACLGKCPPFEETSTGCFVPSGPDGSPGEFVCAGCDQPYHAHVGYHTPGTPTAADATESRINNPRPVPLKIAADRPPVAFSARDAAVHSASGVSVRPMEERLAWDRYASAAYANGDVSPFEACEAADKMLAYRRKRFGSPEAG